MKIWINSITTDRTSTGVPKYSAEMADHFARTCEVTVVAGVPHYPEWKPRAGHTNRRGVLQQGNSTTHQFPLYLPGPERMSSRTRLMYEASFVLNSLPFWLMRAFSSSRPDVLITVCPSLLSSLGPLLYSVFTRTPWVLHVQDLQVDAAVRLGIIRQGLFSRLLFRLEEFFLKQASFVSTITPAMKDRIISKGVPEDRLMVFPNWSDVSFVKPMPRMNAFRQRHGIAEDETVVLYAGNMGDKQGLDLIVEAALQLENPAGLRFVMVGEGVSKRRLMSAVETHGLQNFLFLPVQPLEVLPEMLAAGDIHLVVQKREAADIVMPSKLTNILAAGRSSIATADPGTTLAQVLLDHQCGLVTEPENAAALAKAIQTLAGDVELRTRQGLAARKYAERHLDQTAVLDAFLNDLDNRLRARHPAALAAEILRGRK